MTYNNLNDYERYLPTTNTKYTDSYIVFYSIYYFREKWTI
ncbi:hypothetical protein T190115A13A_10242 [Tenacibaculum sp. 190524A02b]|uniref:Uncharacterized protein n=1 Tax=Tenacibaculum vairaonense TaxID=3137860 RepID=A0ABM9PKB0_9FLAO